MPIAIGLIAGILLWTFTVGWWVAVTLLITGIILMTRKIHYLSFMFYAAAIGWIVACFHEPNQPPKGIFDGCERIYIATIEKITTRQNGQTLILKIDSLNHGEHMIKCPSFKVSATMLPDWSVFVGENVRIKTILEPLDQFGEFPHDRDMHLFYLRQGVVAQAFLEDADLEKTGINKSLKWWLYQRRSEVISLLAHSQLTEESYGLLSAITVGYGDELDNDMRENFRSAGIAHALALSGFHVGIIILLVEIVLFPLRGFYKLRRWRMLLSLAIIWFYAAMVGMPESVVRAVVMLSVILTAKIIGEESNSFNALFVAVAIILACSPFSLFSVGFQLSVCAVLGILALSGPLNPFSRRNRLAYQSAMLFIIPLSAITGTMIVTAATFHRLPLLFGLSNLIISFILPPLMFAGIGVIISTSLGFESLWLCKICDWLTGIIDKTADWIANLSFSELSGIYLTGWQLMSLVVIIIALMLIVNFPKRKNITIGFISVIICGILFLFMGETFPENESFIVGQAGNTSIVMREGHTVRAIFSCHPRRLENSKMRFEYRLTDYSNSRKVDSILISDANFRSFNYSKEGNVLTINGKRIALIAEPGKLDSISGKTDYALICSRFRGSLKDVMNLVNPDTILLGRDLSLRRAISLKNEASVPVIDLRYSRINLN